MANSCSHWWHAPFYIAVSVALAFIAISSLHQEPETTNSSSSSSQFIKRNLSLNASRALRSQGFNVMATLLQISPELFFSTPESTIFAVQDSAISNISGHLPPRAMKQLLQYHTSPTKLPFQALLKKPQESCFATLLPKMFIKITKLDKQKGLIEINNAQITHPDLFLDGPFSVHGVRGSLASLDNPHHLDKDWNLNIRSDPVCDDFSHVSIKKKIDPIQWQGIIQFLSTNGFSMFAIGLQTVVDEIIVDYGGWGSVTVFAPLHFGFLAMPSPLLDRAVRLHILPQRYSYAELGFMPEKSALKTLANGEDVELHKSGSSGALAIDGVAITAPEIFVSENVIIHGISESLGAYRV